MAAGAVAPQSNRPKGRRLDPIEAFEVIPWRALALFRLTTLAYALLLTIVNVNRYAHPGAAAAVGAAMVVWSALATIGYERSGYRAWPLLLVDLGVTAACVTATAPVVGAQALAHGLPTLTVTWMACPALAVAIVKGVRWGIFAALLIGGCDLAVHGGEVNQGSSTGLILLVMATAALGYLANIGVRAQEHLRQAAAADAARAERDRLARRIHDSVLQILALVQRQGEQLGGAAGELGRLAGEQEVALRALIGSGSTSTPAGSTDLRELVYPLASARVSISAPATEVWLPTVVAREMQAAIAEAVENVRRHCPDRTRTWILIEDEGARVSATVRDNGPGIPPGRLDEAADQGRLGVVQAIRGRIADLGGRVRIESASGQGTSVELALPRATDPTQL